MFGRFDPRDDDSRDKRSACERHRGSQAGGHRHAVGGDEDRHSFSRQLDLPQGRERELVRHRGRSYEVNGPEAEALARIGPFRVVHAEDLWDLFDSDAGGRLVRAAVRHLQDSGLLERLPLESRSRDVVVLTKSGRDLLESRRRERGQEPRQAFHAGLRKPRELTHDAQVYRAYLRGEERLHERGASVRRVVLDHELKRDYQQFLQGPNRGRSDSGGRSRREPEEIAAWAREHDLPYFDGSVHFPDARLEYEDQGRWVRHEDIEVVTPHYRGAHAGATVRSGFRTYGIGLRLNSTGRSGEGGRGSKRGLIEELLG
jgi:DNA-binding MarR family transcriptional regulator